MTEGLCHLYLKEHQNVINTDPYTGKEELFRKLAFQTEHLLPLHRVSVSCIRPPSPESLPDHLAGLTPFIGGVSRLASHRKAAWASIPRLRLHCALRVEF